MNDLDDVKFISIHAPREGGDDDEVNAEPHTIISIHAPREGGDKVLDISMKICK